MPGSTIAVMGFNRPTWIPGLERNWVVTVLGNYLADAAT
jgi:hypothetical protein